MATFVKGEWREQSKPTLSQQDKLIYATIAKELGVQAVLATGSRAKGYSKPTSDYDLILPWSAVTKQHQTKIKQLEKKLNIKIDLSPGLGYLPSYGIFIEPT